MVVTSLPYEYATSVPASRMFKAMVTNSHKLFPKVLPHIKSIDVLEGDGGVGTITKTNFVEGSPYKFIKTKIDTLDAPNYSCKYTLSEGDVLGDKLEKVVYEIKFETKGDGCVCKITSHYYAKGDCAIKEEELKDDHEKTMAVYKLVEEYLLANPDVYA